MATIEEKKRQRLAFMHALYEESGGDEGMDVDPDAIAESVGIPAADRIALISFLENHQLMTVDRSTASGSAWFVQIAHRGVLEVEQAMSAPDAPTEHFPPISTVSTIIYGNVSGSQIATAAGDVSQTLTYDGSQNDQVRDLIARYRAALPELDDAVRTIAEQQLDQVSIEVDKAEPHIGIVRGLLNSLKTFAESAVASAGTGAGTLALAELIANWPF